MQFRIGTSSLTSVAGAPVRSLGGHKGSFHLWNTPARPEPFRAAKSPQNRHRVQMSGAPFSDHITFRRSIGSFSPLPTHSPAIHRNSDAPYFSEKCETRRPAPSVCGQQRRLKSYFSDDQTLSLGIPPRHGSGFLPGPSPVDESACNPKSKRLHPVEKILINAGHNDLANYNRKF
jgi:hypothetical protein